MQIPKGIAYISISLILWIVTEFVTVWRMRTAEWLGHMPWVLLQYLLIILVFWFFLFVKRLGHKKAFFIMIALMYTFELLWQNSLLLNAVWFIPASILLIQIWGFLAFVPFWAVEKSLKKNKKLAAFYCLWPALAFVMALLM